MRDGTTPPASQLIDLGMNQNGFPVITVDADGNATGGVRVPTLDVPLGTYRGHNPPISCVLNGSFVAFDAARLFELYPNHAFYVSEVERAVSRAVADGYLLAEDGAVLIQQAQQANVPPIESNGGTAAWLLLPLVALARLRRRPGSVHARNASGRSTWKVTKRR